MEIRKSNLNQVLLVLWKNKKENFLIDKVQEPPGKDQVRWGGRCQPWPGSQLDHVCLKIGWVWVAFTTAPLTTARLQPLPPVVEPGSRAGPSGTSPLLLLLLGQPVTPPPGIPHADLKCLIHWHLQSRTFVEYNHLNLLHVNRLLSPHSRNISDWKHSPCVFQQIWELQINGLNGPQQGPRDRKAAAL